MFLFVSELHDAIFTSDFNDWKEDSDVRFFITADDEGVDVGVFDGVA